MTWTHVNVVKDFYRDSTGRFDVMLRPDYSWVAYDCERPRRGEFDSLTAAKAWCEARSKL